MRKLFADSDGKPSEFTVWIGIAGLALAAGSVAPGCSTTPTAQAVRTLQGSDEMAFVCLGAPGDPNIFHELGDCTSQVQTGITDFGTSVELPHIYALVTQTIQGSVAMVDLATTNGDLLDSDPTTPGAAGFPVGDNPRSIVATPKGTAVFVAAAEVNRPAIYALPMLHIRPCLVDTSQCGKAAPTLSSWPACGLPAAPGKMVMVTDPSDAAGQVRASCGGTYAPPVGTIDAEGKGREKLIVALPSKGELVVIDAESVLDATPGAVNTACPIEKTITLVGTIPPVPTPPAPMPGPACSVPQVAMSSLLGPFTPQPSGLAYSDGKIYVGDIGAPLVHIVDVPTPCTPSEEEPLVATSLADPNRRVMTTKVAVTPVLASTFKRYLYAVDDEDRSTMVFDVSATSMSHTPLTNPDPVDNPLQPPDRFQYGPQPAALAIMTRDQPAGDVSTGVAPFGTLCDPNPDPSVVICNGSNPCDLGTSYRTKGDFSAGAGPSVLRGTFGLVGLSAGAVGIMDIQDFDAPCRGPSTPSKLLGCTSSFAGGVTSDEETCNAVVPNTPRSMNYLISNTYVGNHLPGITAYPILTTMEGDVLDPTKVVAPRIRATLPQAMTTSATPTISVNGNDIPIDPSGFANDTDVLHDTVLVNLEDPHVQVADQQWTIDYEGQLPGFVTKRGDLEIENGQRLMQDSQADYCGSGVESRAAVRATLAADPTEDPSQLEKDADKYADRISLTDPLMDETQGYWSTAACSFQQCQTVFGDDTAPTLNRDIEILEAYDDHLELGEPPAGADFTHCCFPTTVGYAVRGGSQWIVIGSISGFFHHVIPDPATGVCRDSCDSTKARLNGRARTLSGTNTVQDGQDFSFINPMFRFVVTADPTGTPPARDMQFTFSSEGSFAPLRMDLTAAAATGTTAVSRPYVEVQNVTYVPSIDSFVVTDGGLEGLLVVTGDLVGTPKQIF